MENKKQGGAGRGQGRKPEGKIYAHFRLKPETIELVKQFKKGYARNRGNDALDDFLNKALKIHFETIKNLQNE